MTSDQMIAFFTQPLDRFDVASACMDGMTGFEIAVFRFLVGAAFERYMNAYALRGELFTAPHVRQAWNFVAQCASYAEQQEMQLVHERERRRCSGLGHDPPHSPRSR